MDNRVERNSPLTKDDSHAMWQSSVWAKMTCLDLFRGFEDFDTMNMEEISMQKFGILGKALNLSLGTESGYETESGSEKPERWKTTPLEDWTSSDVMDWIYSQAAFYNADLSTLRGENFQKIDGRKLSQMTEEDFTVRDEMNGKVLYQCLQNYRSQHTFNQGPLTQNWNCKHPQEWTTVDVLDWIYYGSGMSGTNLICLKGEMFQGIDGPKLCSMACADFVQRDEEYGLMLFSSFQNFCEKFLKSEEIVRTSQSQLEEKYGLVSSSGKNALDAIRLSSAREQNMKYMKTQTSDLTFSNSLIPHEKKHLNAMISKKQKREPSRKQNSSSRKSQKRTKKTQVVSSEDMSDDELEPSTKMPRQSSKTRLWKFMRDLLDNPQYNPDCIRWENKEEGIFRIVAGRSKVIAELWGKIKNNPTMTFDKLGRSLRWCRANNGKFSAVPKDGKFPRKLCFRLVDPDANESKKKKVPTATLR